MEGSSLLDGINSLSTMQDPAINRSTVKRDDFLKLLIAQMSNQDPLSPVDNQEFAAQLAQFSSLEQLQSIDTNIQYGVDMDMALTQSINNTLAATIIGRGVKASGNTVITNEEGIAQLSFDLSAQAKDVTVTITDSAGSVVREISLGTQGPGVHTIDWDGKNNNGVQMPDDTYQFSVTATDGNGNSISVTPLIQGIISGVRFADGSAYLLIGNQEISFGSVIEIAIALQDQG